jgi:hypothetical protein
MDYLSGLTGDERKRAMDAWQGTLAFRLTTLGLECRAFFQLFTKIIGIVWLVERLSARLNTR